MIPLPALVNAAMRAKFLRLSLAARTTYGFIDISCEPHDIRRKIDAPPATVRDRARCATESPCKALNQYVFAAICWPAVNQESGTLESSTGYRLRNDETNRDREHLRVWRAVADNSNNRRCSYY